MARICRAEGVPETALLLETKALTTEENIVLSGPLIAAFHPPSVIIVTDRYHAARARLVARRLGLPLRVECPELIDAPRWRVARAWMREAVALTWYWLRGAGR